MKPRKQTSRSGRFRRIISHVLEHVSMILSLSHEGEFRAILKEGGLVRITVPCLDCSTLFRRERESDIDWGMALQNAHTYTFSEKTLRELLLIAGFEPVVLVRGFLFGKKYHKKKVDFVNLRKNRAADTRRLLASSERLL